MGKFVNVVSTGSAGGAGSAQEAAQKTLSRNELYTPMMAYEQTKVDPSTYMGSQPSIPRSLKETTLTNFLHNVSVDYHRHQATGEDPKNNGSRPLSLGDMDDRIRQRAVTLVGGGVSKGSIYSINPDAKKKKTLKRPRREWEQVREILAKSKVSSSSQHMDAVAFLRQLNARWNAYMVEVLGMTASNKRIDDSSIKTRFILARSCIELVGAHVNVNECSQHRGLVGAFGVVVGETKNTWRVVVRQRNRGQERIKTTNAKDEESAEAGKVDGQSVSDITKVVTVPKRGSLLELIIPLNPKEFEKELDGRTAEHGTPMDKEIIQQAEESVYITIDPDSEM